MEAEDVTNKISGIMDLDWIKKRAPITRSSLNKKEEKNYCNRSDIFSVTKSA